MTAARIDGKTIAQEILTNLQEKVQQFTQKNIIPHLVIVLVGDDPASAVYVRQKELKAESIGIKPTVYRLPSTITETEILAIIDKLNQDNAVHGIIVQQPLPSHIHIPTIVEAVEAKKDVDGFHSETSFPMPLAAAVIKILEHVFKNTARGDASEGPPQRALRSNEERLEEHWGDKRVAGPRTQFESWLRSQNIVVMGKGETGGKPVTQALKARGANVAVVDSKTQNPQELTKKATVIISAVGRKNIITPEMISQEVILISVGLHKGEDGKLHGDYEKEKIAEKASFYTPTPGGVGPVNVAMLLENLLLAVEKQL